jgi:hypothetical protein
VVVTRELTDSHGKTDASLVRAAATDASAFGELYERHVEASIAGSGGGSTGRRAT